MAFDAEFQSLPSGVAGSEKETSGRTVRCCNMVEPRCIWEMLCYCRNYLLLERNVGEGDGASHLIATVMEYQRNVSLPEKRRRGGRAMSNDGLDGT